MPDGQIFMVAHVRLFSKVDDIINMASITTICPSCGVGGISIVAVPEDFPLAQGSRWFEIMCSRGDGGCSTYHKFAVMC